MRILVYGAGAVGGALAVRLATAGADVSVVARGEHAAAIRANGLTLLAGETRRTVRLDCVEDPHALAHAPQVVFVTTKQTHLPAIAKPLASLIARGARIVLAMNGIGWWFAGELPIPGRDAFVDTLDPGRALRDSLDPRALVGAVVQSSNEVVAPGVVLSTTPARNRMILGSVVSGAVSGIDAIADALRGAGYEAYESHDIRRDIWKKMSLWLAVAPASAITGLALDRLASAPDGFATMTAVMRETIALGRRLGFTLPDDAEEQIGFYRDKPARPSLLKDFELRREPELASGVFVFDALAKALGMPAPHIATIAALARLRYEAIKSSA